MNWKRKIKPDLPLDKVPLSYKPGKSPWLTGRVISGPSYRPEDYSKENIQKAKDYWAKRKETL